MARSSLNPGWIAALTGNAPVWLLARLALVSSYLIGGVDKALHFHAAVAEQAHFGLRPAWLWALLAVIVEIAGSLAVILNKMAWLGAGALGCLTLVAMLAANDFWNMSGHGHFVALNTFFEHLGLIAGLVLVVIKNNR